MRLTIFWILTLICLLLSASVLVDVSAQFWLAGLLVLFLIVARNRCETGILRYIYLLCICFISIRYLSWRSFETLSWHDPFSFIGMLLLYLAEVYGIILAFLGIMVSIRPLERRVPALPVSDEEAPSVDVFITSYNESVSMLEVTILAARQMQYPQDKLNVYLLDDGGTDEKRTHADSALAREAVSRHQALQKLCKNTGARYLTREDNRDHKAGNVNAALKKTSGELVVILDADHVPAIDFLEKTVGYFKEDPRLFLVQTPHYFINADPIEKNLDIFDSMPAENEMFFRVMQKGLDFWNAALFAGSAAVLRRTMLEEHGGFAVDTVTEDAETALELHSQGYNSVYQGQPLISGLAPESFSAFITQRARWATGMLQILILKNPLRRAGLSLSQKLCYLTNCLYWLFPFARVVFLLAPTLFLFFGLRIYDASLLEVLAYTVPHYWASLRLSEFQYGKVRWPFVSILYETLQSLFSLNALWKVIRNPRAPKFVVTPKGEHLDKDFISPMAVPFYLIFIILILAYFVAGYRLVEFPDTRASIVIVLFWHSINVLIMLAALGALSERRQRRAVPRVHTTLIGELRIGDAILDCHLDDVSTGGAELILISKQSHRIQSGSRGSLQVDDKQLAPDAINVEIASVRHVNGESYLGVRFINEDVGDQAKIVRLVHGSSERWLNDWESHDQRIGAIKGLSILVWRGIIHSRNHLTEGMNLLGSSARNYFRMLIRAS